MIKIEHVVLPSEEQMEFVVEAMRNPMNSWKKSDSVYCDGMHGQCSHCNQCEHQCVNGYLVGKEDQGLMKRLAKAGTEHRTYMRMMPVMVRLTAPLYWWKEMDRYTIGKTQVSCSTMHKIHAKRFVPSDFSHELLLDDYTDEKVYSSEFEDWDATDLANATIDILNAYRKRYLNTKERKYWDQLIQLLPSSYNQTRNVNLNYEVLSKIYRERKGHKLDEWCEFCKWIETLPLSELITGVKEE